MAAYAKVKLTEDANYLGDPYKEGDVLRMPTDAARRTLAAGKAVPYTGTAKPKNDRDEKTLN